MQSNMQSYLDSFDNTVRRFLSPLDNEYVTAGLALFLILYSSLAAPKLPSYIAKLFDNTWFKLLCFFLIVYVSRKNATVAIIAAVAVMISLMTLNKIKFNESMMVVANNRAPPAICNCNQCKSNCTCGCVAADLPMDQDLINEMSGTEIHGYYDSPMNEGNPRDGEMRGYMDEAPGAGWFQNTNDVDLVGNAGGNFQTELRTLQKESLGGVDKNDFQELDSSVQSNSVVKQVLTAKKDAEAKMGRKMTEDEIKNLCNSYTNNKEIEGFTGSSFAQPF